MSNYHLKLKQLCLDPSGLCFMNQNHFISYKIAFFFCPGSIFRPMTNDVIYEPSINIDFHIWYSCRSMNSSLYYKILYEKWANAREEIDLENCVLTPWDWESKTLPRRSQEFTETLDEDCVCYWCFPNQRYFISKNDERPLSTTQRQYYIWENL